MKKGRTRPNSLLSRRSKTPLRAGLTPEALADSIIHNLHIAQGRIAKTATRNDWYMAVALTVRDRIMERWMRTIELYMGSRQKSVSYLSAEFLIGPQLESNLYNLGIYDEMVAAVESLGQEFDFVLDQEREPGLGNGGLGRLAACYIESMASLRYLGVGYGIRYEFGIFRQMMNDGWQVETPDKWLRLGNPWEITRPEISFTVPFGGHTEHTTDRRGDFTVVWHPEYSVRGVACDIPVPGYRVNTVNLLRLWKAEAAESFDLQAFNEGNYYGAVENKVASENITKVLYPNDQITAGKLLRLQQQYFFVSCSLQDLFRVHFTRGCKIEEFHRLNAIQLNDTHPSIAVAELMRLLVDVNRVDWDTAWEITRNTFAYTNHTLLPEALEKWPLPLFARLLPRHLEIIFEINRRFLERVRVQTAADGPALERLSIIDESGERSVRMANLACVGSHAVNGVAKLHTELLKTEVLGDFYRLSPEKFVNVTNGVTQRRWILQSNPKLAALISSRIGDRWVTDMEGGLPALEPFADDAQFRKEWRQIKFENKVKLALLVLQRCAVDVNADSLFDVQVKRIHEYKRQHLNLLHVIRLYNKLKQNPAASVVPRTVLVAGKAAPGYAMAKLIIKLINTVADCINSDRDTGHLLTMAFIPDFNVKIAQIIYPGADLSEQISTAGKEASGTGNMKFAMNGALTIGTLDGANIEIREAVGPENFFLFGLTADEVVRTRKNGYDPMEYVRQNDELRQIIEQLRDGYFCNGDKDLFKPIVDNITGPDPYMIMADFDSYVKCQEAVEDAYRDEEEWTKRAILNVARMAPFSSDRSVREYAKKIWQIEPVRI
ncbi:MAG: alpha-1,4 glucan phosphorylase [Bacteroidia bacterium]|nr:MAG: alpha-1,4 glucan phosphorylase [Bacteroidia bacterium]